MKKKEFEGDLILKKNTTFKCNIKVNGNIRCEGGIWNIDAWNINAGDIDAWNINAGDINAGDINAGDIDAGNINAWNIICERRIKKFENSKTICRVYIQNKSKIKIEEKD